MGRNRVGPGKGSADGAAGVSSTAAHDRYRLAVLETGNRHREGGKRRTIVSLGLIIGRHRQVRPVHRQPNRRVVVADCVVAQPRAYCRAWRDGVR